VRADDLAAIPLKALMERYPVAGWAEVDDVILGCANQAGEDNRNVARMAVLLAGLPIAVAGTTVNRLCGSGLDAVGMAARAIRAGDCEFVLAGGVESMSRAPFVMPKAEAAFTRTAAIYDTTIGWRFPNPRLKSQFGNHAMPETADEVAAQYRIGRADQDSFALRSQQRWAAAQADGLFKDEIVPVNIPRKSGGPIVVTEDEHPRPATTAQDLAKLKGINGPDLSVTAGNASGVNDGAAALSLASEAAARKHGLVPKVRILATAAAGVEPRIMGIGPVPAVRKALSRAGLKLDQMDVIELNEAFAAQSLAVLRELGLADDAQHVNPNGGAIALGHPLGMSGARLVTTAMYQLLRTKGRYALCTMCVGVGQGIALVMERV
jgi:3-oxoadipyl-CoA thiolase